MHYNTLVLEEVPSLFNRPERDKCSAETQEFAGKMIIASVGKAVLFRLSEELSLKLSIRNTWHAEIIYTSLFINAEIKFISLMSK